MTRILVAEDDASLNEVLQLFLEKEGYRTTFCRDGTGVVEAVRETEPDLLILDWMLPGKDGLSILREVRRFSDVPVLMLTARDGDVDQVLGLESGADDYVTKPFSPFTLLARIKALLRRAQQTGNPAADKPEEREVSKTARDRVVEGTRFRLNPDTHEVVMNGRVITGLTPKEFDLLVFMARNPKYVFSREQLIERVWGYDFIGDERTVDAHIKRLRRKIATPPFTWIHTVWGVGYKFDEEIRDEN